jgi:hypothetical protein
VTEIALIPLSRGLVTKVNAHDLESLKGYNWTASANPGGPYARRAVWANGRTAAVLMHRQILGLDCEDSRVVDHINRDRLDNRRENLRIVSQAQNLWNSAAHRDSTTGLKGAFWEKRRKRFYAKIATHGKQRFLGYFDTAEQAHSAYRRAAEIEHGEFARSAA